MKGLSIKLHDLLVLGLLVSWDDYKPRGQIAVVPHGVAQRRPSHVDLGHRPPVAGGEGSHVQDVVVWE